VGFTHDPAGIGCPGSSRKVMSAREDATAHLGDLLAVRLRNKATKGSDREPQLDAAVELIARQ
jgi:hypothetical protein